MSSTIDRPLRRGDVVQVRSPAEILATLDGDGCLEGVPFMPEMLRHVGRRYTVTCRVEKICDTIASTGSRRMLGTVYLDDIRCDGSEHGGCQAGCRVYWKEAWLSRIDREFPPRATGQEGMGHLENKARGTTRTVRQLDGQTEDVWRCQATEALKATEPLKTSDIRQYWRELKFRNVGLLHFFRVAVTGLFTEIASRTRLIKPSPLTGKGASLTREPLDLLPGDLVQVRSPAEIAPTLDSAGLNRGLSFDREMLPYCGRTFRVQDRVRRLIDDRTGRMVEISRDCLILEGVVCTGERSVGRWFCPREIYPYWREAWLRKVEPSVDPDA